MLRSREKTHTHLSVILWGTKLVYWKAAHWGWAMVLLLLEVMMVQGTMLDLNLDVVSVQGKMLDLTKVVPLGRSWDLKSDLLMVHLLEMV